LTIAQESTGAPTYPRLTGQLEGPVTTLSRIGDHTLSYGKAIAATPFAAVHYRREVVRLIAEISMGAGTLAMIGGTVVIIGFLMLAAGGTLAVQLLPGECGTVGAGTSRLMYHMIPSIMYRGALHPRPLVTVPWHS
jgi:hypothetical protein